MVFQQLTHGGAALLSRSAKLNRKNSKLVTVFLTLVLAMSGLVQSPAHASSAPNGLYSCTTGVISESYDEPSYQIANHLVGGGGSCAGAVVIPIGVTAIGPNAFSGSSLTSITIPATVTHILAGAFYQATQLTSITIPASVTTIGDAAFRGATALNSVTIPASVTSIGAGAFYEASALTSITIPASVTSIGANAFYGATALTSITIPASVTSIGNQAFYGATNLATVTFAPGSQLTSIGEYAFGQTALTSVTIPASLTSIDQSAFRSAALLTTVTFAPGSQLTSIGQYAFYGTALTNFTIPASVTSIDTYAFYGASLLSDITVDGANLNYSSVDGVLFNKNSDTLIINLKGRSGTSYTIPATVISIGEGAFDETALTTVTFAPGSQLTSIGDWSFYGAAFTSITIPASVTSIGAGAFYDASVLTDVYFLGNAPDIAADADAFYGVAAGARALVRSAATGFGTVGETWENLTVQTGVYLVTYNTFGGSLVTAEDYGANIATPTSPTRNGDTFAGWSLTDGGSVITFPYTPASAGDITLYARWTVAPTAATTKPTVTGSAKVGKTLTANKGTWTGSPAPTFTYQWYACTQKVLSATQTVPGTCATINGATQTTFKLTTSHTGKYITVKVTGTSSGTPKTLWLAKTTTTKVT